jgi:hypothetical protein
MFFKPKPKAPIPPENQPEVIDQEFSLISTTEGELESNEEEAHELDENDLRDDSFQHDDGEDMTQEEIDEEDRRNAAYQVKKKNDKIFNNSYNMGDGPEQEYSGKSIKLSSTHSESHLYDPERYRDHLDYQIVQRDIQAAIETSPDILRIIASEPNKKKYTKQEINTIFLALKLKLNGGTANSVFVSPIHILEAVSGLTMLEYRKLFDMLEYEHKAELLEELNQKFNILGNPSFRTKRFF